MSKFIKISFNPEEATEMGFRESKITDNEN